MKKPTLWFIISSFISLTGFSDTYVWQFWKEENGERVKAAVGEAVAACVRFDQASGSMTPIMIPEVFSSKVQQV